MSIKKFTVTKVLFVGEEPKGSAPILTWAKSLQTLGIECIFVGDLGTPSISEFYRLVNKSDLVVYQGYHGPTDFELRQLTSVQIAGRPLIRMWSGSDVLYCLESKTTRRQALRLNRLTSCNLSSNNQLLIDELASIGITAQLLPQIIDPDNRHMEIVDENCSHTLLVYLPTTRLEFYGAEKVKTAAKRNPDINFLVIGDESHSLAYLPNVKSLGWITDMEPIWQQVGGIIRLTRHDGLPRMLIEGLARGKYVIHSFPLEGAWIATCEAETQAAIEQFRHKKTYNKAGVESAKYFLTSRNDYALITALEQSQQAASSCKIIASVFMLLGISLSFRIKSFLNYLS